LFFKRTGYVPAIFCANYLPFITNPPNLKRKKKKTLIILQYQIIETFTNGGILLRKWAANHPPLIPKSHKPNLNVSFDKDPYNKTLGLL
jgi:hypothetical protein